MQPPHPPPATTASTDPLPLSSDAEVEDPDCPEEGPWLPEGLVDVLPSVEVAPLDDVRPDVVLPEALCDDTPLAELDAGRLAEELTRELPEPGLLVPDAV